MGSFEARVYRRFVGLAVLAVLPAIAVVTYDQALERRAARERILDADLRLTGTAAARQAAVFTGAARLLDTLAQFPGVRASAAGECSGVLAAVLRGHPGYTNLAVLRADGTVFCSANPNILSRRFDDRPWMRRVVAERTLIAGDYQLSSVNGRPDIVLARPLLDPTRRLERVLVAGIEVGRLDRLAAAIRLPPGATLTVFDRSGVVLARYPDDVRSGGRRLPERLRDLPPPGSERSFEARDADGVERLHVTVPVDAGLDTGIYVSIGTERALMFAAADRLLARDLGIVALLGLFALGVAIAGGRRFVLAPLHVLTATTERIAGGDLSARAELHAGAPGFSALGGAVNAMAVALEVRARGQETLHERLQASEARYRLMFERNPHPMWVYDVNTLEFLEINDAAIRQYGYTRDEFAAMRVTDLRPPEAVPDLMATLEILRAGARFRSDVSGHRLKSGRLIDVEIVSDAIAFQGRQARLVLAHDITERVRMERRLREAEERLRFALEASKVGVWEVNLTADTAYWSESWGALHGVPPGTSGGNLDDLIGHIHPDDRQAVRAAVTRAIRERRDLRLEYRTIWPDGTEHRIVATGRFASDDTGAPVRGAGVAMDVTERRSLEDQFRQAQKMEAVGQLAGGIAHDFNNVLTAIMGNADFVLEDLPAGHRARADVEEIQRAARRAADLTHRLLAFSRKQILRPRVLHLGDVVGEVTPMLRRLIGEAIDLRTVTTDRQSVRADPGQIEQVLVNLAVNARDAMPGGGRLTIETSDVVVDEAYGREHPTARPGPHVVLVVGDTGHGMDAATRAHIFEPFFTTKPKGQGTGLGLATVYGIVTQSGGHIRVSSEIGRGTTFKVYLPQTADVETAPPPSSGEGGTLEGHETILLIEGEDAVREFVYKTLGRHGYLVHPMPDSKQAVAFAAAHHGPIDLVLADVVLPDRSGREAVRQVQEAHPEAKALYTSGYTDNAVHQGVLDSGTPFLQKPFTGEVLLRRVREVLADAAQRTP